MENQENKNISEENIEDIKEENIENKEQQKAKDEMMEELFDEAENLEDSEEREKQEKIKKLDKVEKIVNHIGDICLCVAVILSAFVISNMNTKITELETTVEKQGEQIKELATFNNYSLASHKEIKTLAKINEDATAFRSSDYFNNNKLADGLSLGKTFGQDTSENDTYYVLFYMESCSHCNELESDMYDSITKVIKKTIYYYDADTFTDECGFKWSSSDVDETYKVKKNNFELAGTPSLVKVTAGSEKVKVFIGADAIEEELGI